jgi:membrane-associated PAP2 superfamily phosphatase
VIPGVVSLIKGATTVYYPYKVQRYGGKLPYRKLYRSLRRRPGEPASRGFPAGHASGGFALFGLYFAARTRAGRIRGALTGLCLGWILGLYQMLKGAHYLSHTVVSMLLGWLLAALLARLFGLTAAFPEPGPSPKSAPPESSR